MITTRYRTRRTTIWTGGSRRRRPRRLAPLKADLRSTSTTAAPVTRSRIVFQDGGALSPAEVATLRMFAAAGIRPRCVVEGTEHAPDAAQFRAALAGPT